MYPVHQNFVVESPTTKIGAWCAAVCAIAFWVFMEACYAGIFATGLNDTTTSKNAEELFGGLFMMIIGIFVTTFWPIILWDEIKE